MSRIKPLFVLIAAMTALAAPAPALAAEGAVDDLIDRIWIAEPEDENRPGVMRIFLRDGTLLQDSCFETYRLSRWEMSGDATISWDEDGTEIGAELTFVDDERLTLTLQLGSDSYEQRFVPAEVPFICPDLPT